MIKSQDNLNTCNDGHRSSDVLVATIEKCERLQKQLKIAIEGLEAYQEDRWSYEDEYENYPWGSGGGWCWAEQALNQIKELEK